MDFFIGQICLFPWKWAPRGWARCDGTLLPINENQALFSLIRYHLRRRRTYQLRAPGPARQEVDQR
jgi:microcystin-dependent protein